MAEEHDSGDSPVDRWRSLRRISALIWKRRHKVLTGVAVLLLTIGALIFGVEVVNNIFSRGSVLQVTATVNKTVSANQTKRELVGWVADDNGSVEGVTVLAIAEDEFGNTMVIPAPENSDAQGKFTIDVSGIGDKGVIQVKATEKSRYSSSRVAETSVRFGSNKTIYGTTRRESTVERVPIALSISIGVFIVFLIYAVCSQPGSESGLRRKYHISGGIGLLLATCTLYAYSDFYFHMAANFDEHKVVSIGVASVFHGTYDEKIDEDWIISLSQAEIHMPRPAEQSGGSGESPPDPIPDSEPTNLDNKRTNVSGGFGAPLWVLLLSVVGSTSLVIVRFITEIADPPKFEDGNAIQDVNRRVRGFVQNDFYVFFAPIGGMFVYQALVLAEAATKSLTVAVVALGAGVTVNGLLALGIERAEGLFKGKGKDKDKDKDKGKGDGD